MRSTAQIISQREGRSGASFGRMTGSCAPKHPWTRSLCKEKQVSIIYRLLPQYRASFFQDLRDNLAGEKVKLSLFYGRTRGNPKKDEVDLEWATFIHQTQIDLFGKTLLYQHLPDSIYQSDLIILMQENRLLSNFTVARRARRNDIKTAFWGHGINLQDQPNSVANRWKRLYSVRSDWWFAYTGSVKRRLIEMGYPEERITTVNNAIDTRTLIKARAAVSEEQKDQVKQELGLGEGPIAIYCGAMYPEKRLPFLLEACQVIKRDIPTFELILIGAGPDALFVKQFAATHPWAHYIGSKFGLERVPYFAVSEALLIPALVGLAVLDSFALATPIITTNHPFHGPEIDYLEHDVNGLISDNELFAFSRLVADAITNRSKMARLRQNGLNSAGKYTVEAMVSSFAGGVLSALHTPSIGSV